VDPFIKGLSGERIN